MSRSELATAKGIDHDYNYLTSLERAIERADRHFTAQGVIIHGDDSDDGGGGPLYSTRAGPARKGGQGGGKNPATTPKGEIPLKHALQRSGVHIIRAPAGLSRAKANHTRWAKKRHQIVWTVEWVHPDGSKEVGECAADSAIGSVYEVDVVLAKRKREGYRPRKKRRLESAGGEVLKDGGEAEGAASAQGVDPLSQHHPPSRFQFHLHIPADPSSPNDHPHNHNQKITLHPVSPTDTLTSILNGRTVLEYPIIYVFAARSYRDSCESESGGGGGGREDIPAGFVIQMEEEGTKDKEDDGEKKIVELEEERRGDGEEEKVKEKEEGMEGAEEAEGKGRDGSGMQRKEEGEKKGGDDEKGKREGEENVKYRNR